MNAGWRRVALFGKKSSQSLFQNARVQVFKPQMVQIRSMSLVSHYQRLLTNHVVTKTNYLTALREIEQLCLKEDYGHEIAETEFAADNYTDLLTLFDTLQACLLARSKMEDHHYLPIIQEDVTVSDLLTSDQKKKIHAYSQIHIKEHIHMNHAKKIVDDLHKSHVRTNPKNRKELVKNLKEELSKVAVAVHSLFQREEEEILSPVFSPKLSNDQREYVHSNVIDNVQYEELNLTNTDAIARRLAEITLDEILRFRQIASDRQGDVGDSLLSEFRKKLPHHIWLAIAQNYPDLSDDAI